ncbi:M18 family aminopeptidase [Marinomonas sp. M1K-6]|uniref:M18 family aminopeptidase n=1 Tax=Marinomonas profundi TaxID=2726122 RepID=A0A847QYU7_9GAMM|nr:M18 family aminopeptidase [Marinomonas profundi]NLQ16061.1 M18 family aminopeptidase [Marinomonas profundi]UDV03351.1 M18 family aminopeptidase [Marinomonas profundi]
MEYSNFNDGLLSFLQASPTPFHATTSMRHALLQDGFIELLEDDSWVIEEGGKYFVTRNQSSLIAFTTPQLNFSQRGWRMIGAHTDSPCLKLKPNAQVDRFGYHQLGVEVYGGVLLHTWLDRDLSIAGRITLKTQNGDIVSRLVDFKDPIAVVPNLAIHLNRQANEGFSVNPQEEILPILCGAENAFDLHELLKTQLKKQHADLHIETILDFELSLYDTQPAALVGLHKEYICSARLDNLLSCYVGLQALLSSDSQRPSVLICTDHEEVGSLSTSGANGPFLDDVLRRLMPNPEQYVQAIQRSMLVSADNAHGLHPNYAHKHDKNHAPAINKGAVIKVNANQRYATNSETASIYRDIAAEENYAVQCFVVRSDMACGSTIGPITSGEIGVPTIDIGLPTFGMHSIRELAGSRDAYGLYKVLARFTKREKLIAR